MALQNVTRRLDPATAQPVAGATKSEPPTQAASQPAPAAPAPGFEPSSNATIRPRTATSLQLPAVPAPGAQAAPAAAAPASYDQLFGQRSYVKEGTDAQLVALVRQAVAQSPELANGPLAAAATAGTVGPHEVRALQQHLESKGYSVGRTGVDGKYGPLTHQAMSDFLAGKPPAAAQPAPPAQTGPEADPSGRTVLNNPLSYHISQYPGATNTRERTQRNGNCGPTSVLMALKAFGYVNPSPSEVDAANDQIRARGGATREERVGRGSGTSVDQLAQAARSYGANAQARTGQSLADVERDLAAGKRVVVLVSPRAYSSSRSRGHYVLVTGVRNGQVIVNDPAQQSGGRVINARHFERAMRTKGGQTVAIQ